MSRSKSRILGCLAAALLFASLTSSPAYAQLGHRIVHDWTIGWNPDASRSGYSPASRCIGLTEWEGDVDGTYISWGFGGVMTDWSATTIAGAAGGAFAVFLIAGGLTLATFNRRRGRP